MLHFHGHQIFGNPAVYGYKFITFFVIYIQLYRKLQDYRLMH